METEVTNIDFDNKTVYAKSLVDGTEYKKLMIKLY